MIEPLIAKEKNVSVKQEQVFVSEKKSIIESEIPDLLLKVNKLRFSLKKSTEDIDNERNQVYPQQQLFTDKEKFEFLTKKNPVLIILVETFNLSY